MMGKGGRAIEILRHDGIKKLLKEGKNFTRTQIEESIFVPIINHLYSDGVDMAEEDWDHMLILDACRADMFEEVVGEVGDKYRRRRSNASATPEWIERTFAHKSMGDAVYVSANLGCLDRHQIPFTISLISGSNFTILRTMIWRMRAAWGSSILSMEPRFQPGR